MAIRLRLFVKEKISKCLYSKISIKIIVANIQYNCNNVRTVAFPINVCEFAEDI
jgi:hypothetical protein